MAYVSLAARAAVGLVFVVALLNKLRSRARRTEFVAATRRLAPDWLGRLVPAVTLAATVAVAEACIVALLSAPGTGAWGLALAMGVAGIFAAAIGAALRRDDRSPCNCFGASTRPLGLGQLMRNLLLITIAGLGMVAELAGDGPAGLAGTLVALAAGGVLAILLVFADDIADLFRPMATPR